jgi:tetrapyrrole methylase family protein/MazG family protein
VKLAIGEALDTRSELGSGLARRGAGDDHVRGAGLLPDDLRVTVIQRLGLPDEHIVTVAWDDLDRVIEPDHLTSVWIPAYVAPVAFEVQRFAELVATLRRECPWDQEQTHESLKRHLLVESYEVIDALDGVDPDTGEGYEHLEEELGDLLFQIVFHTTLASEAGQFTLADVARGVHDKLHSRHPHVFGQADADDAEQVAANWEDLKKAEKGRSSVFDGIPDALPALLYALKVQKKAAALGVGSTIGDGTAGIDGAPVIPSVDDALAGVRAAGERPEDGVATDLVGELLFSVVDLARSTGVDPETALRSATLRHRDAVHRLEQDAVGDATVAGSGDASRAPQ